MDTSQSALRPLEMNKKMNVVTRREFLATAAAMAAFRAVGSPAAPVAATGTLRRCAAEKGILFGSALSIDSMNDAEYAPLFAEQCGILVPESEMKWAALRPSPQKFDFVRADALCGFAAEHGMAVRGHTLIWENALPSWFNYYATSSNAEQLMTDHISTVMRRYAGKVSAWDVVNEANFRCRAVARMA